MPPSDDAHADVEAAALALFTEQGYAQTTVDQIVSRAGVARRTFFRHFSSKREILFWGQATLAEAHAMAIAAAPADSSPLQLIAAALYAAADVMAPRRTLVRQRQTVIAESIELQERELYKRSQLSRSLAQALAGRGVEPVTAAVGAEAALGAYGLAFRGWAEGRGEDLHAAVADALQGLEAISRPR